MPARLYKPSHPRGGLGRLCNDCGKRFIKTARYCRVCLECTMKNQRRSLEKRKTSEYHINKCNKCNKVVREKTGVLYLTKRYYDGDAKREQKQMHIFCERCWKGIANREQLKPNGVSFKTKERISKIIRGI